MSRVDLTAAEATKRCLDIDTAREDIVQKLRLISSEQQDMLRTGWKGNAAGKYDIDFQAAADDYRVLINFLDNLCQTAKLNVNDLVTAEDG